jgi:phosphopantothenoylcysteine decarboxylase/phosphopantothenate--cysteine ligase
MTSVVLGVTGGIAAYKAVELLRLLRESGLEVNVVPTQSALRFVGEPTWSALSGNPVATDVWTRSHEVPHVALGQDADLVLVAPATADFLARAVHGMASDLLTNVLLTARCPVIVAPAMHTEMWAHPATRANVATLRSRGVVVLEPAYGRLTGADTGPGRLPDPARILDSAFDVLHGRGSGRTDLASVRAVISVGGTREPWDDVRFLGNRSSGKQGFALARAAVARGALVTVVVGSVEEPVPAGCSALYVTSAEDMRQAMHAVVADQSPDVVVMAAAVADFRPERESRGKITKESLGDDPGAVPELALVRTTDILAELVAKRGSQTQPIIVGFAAETPEPGEALVDRARAKLLRKGCDFLVANAVNHGAVFGQDETSVVVLDRRGGSQELVGVDKVTAAHALWDTLSPVIDSNR